MKLQSRDRLIVVEDEPIFLDALAALLAGIDWVEVVKVPILDRDTFVCERNEATEDAQVVTFNPCPNGRVDTELIEAIHEKWPRARLVAITHSGDGMAFRACLGLGVQSVLLKTEPPETIKAGVELVCRGAVVFSLPAAASVIAPMKPLVMTSLPFPLSRGLSPREVEILQLIGRGYTDSEIGGFIGASTRTINRHVTNILNKLGCRNRSQAVAQVLGCEPTLVQRSVSYPMAALVSAGSHRNAVSAL